MTTEDLLLIELFICKLLKSITNDLFYKNVIITRNEEDVQWGALRTFYLKNLIR